MAVKLGTSFDVVEAVRALAAGQQSLEGIMAAFEARMQVLELGRQPLIQVGELVAETEMSGKLAGRVKKA